MSIFSFWKKVHTEESDFILTSDKVRSYPWGQVCLQAVLVTMLVFASFGGLLAAYGISYNILFCVTAVFVEAAFLAAVYATGKRWLINLALIGSLVAYFAFSLKGYWYVNSGYYGVLNRILEDAREYLAIFNGTEYDLVVTDEYQAITYFVLFIGFIAALLFSIRFARGYGLLHVLCLTLPFYLIPMYFEKNPGMGYLILLWTAYVLVALLHGLEKGDPEAARWRYLLVILAVFALCMRIFTAVITPENYTRSVSANSVKKASEKQIGTIVQSGFSALFGGGRAGMSGGRLGNNSVSPDYETDLVVQFTPYSYEPIYLKGFLGVDYDGSRWIPPQEAGVREDFFTSETLSGLKENSQDFSMGKMVIDNVGADEDYSYYPYYTDDSGTTQTDEGNLYTYYPYHASVQAKTTGVDEKYLVVPDRCLDAVEQVCSEADFQGTPEEIADQIIRFFQDNYSYTLTPGNNWSNRDYITHFLLGSKRGYCMHFASAGVMMFRNMGIPARYAEGYVFSYNDMLVDGELVEDQEYADYFTGVNELGQTGVIRLEIPDANAHAWVEIYVKGKGWIVVDTTPAASPGESEEADSFWDAFRQRNRDLSSDGMIFATNAAEYIGRAVNWIMWLAIGIAGVLVIILLLRRMEKRRREQQLPAREQVRGFYREFISEQCTKHSELSESQTIRKQLEVLKKIHYKKNRRKTQNKQLPDLNALQRSLYEAFYGREMTKAQYEELLRLLKELKKQM